MLLGIFEFHVFCFSQQGPAGSQHFQVWAHNQAQTQQMMIYCKIDVNINIHQVD